jgi:V/A-type H+/Na+-transporting ATPase subunit D
MSSTQKRIIPTRSELVRTRKRKKLAESILEILKKELEDLLHLLVNYKEMVKVYKSFLHAALDKSYHHYILSEMLIGTRKIKELASNSNFLDFSLKMQKSLGNKNVSLSKLALKIKNKSEPRTNISLLDVPMEFEEAEKRFNDVLEFIVELANINIAIREIMDLILLKRRQIHTLQFKKIPELENSIRTIENILEEIEQQDAIRVRVLQRKRK